MGFTPISMEAYIQMHLKNNPSEKEDDLRNSLISALKNYENGVKCSCGNDIWVIGSAFVGNSCFTCITGESVTDKDYEIDSAIKKRENKRGRRHIDQMDKTEIHGFFDDDGYEIDIDSVKKPSLCLTCAKDDDPNEELLCQMNRCDQRNNTDFQCYAYVEK